MEMVDHSSSSSSSSSQILSIPVDLVMDILKRLSVRDVLRSRPVCKEWNSLLRTPKFISLHYNRSLQMRQENPASFVYLRTIPSRPPFQGRPRRTFDARPRWESITLTFFSLEKTTTKLVAKVDKEEDILAMLSSLLFPSCSCSCPTLSDMYIEMVCPLDGLVCFLCGCTKHIIMYNPATRESQVLPSHPNFFVGRTLGAWFESNMEQQYKVFRLITDDDDHWYKITIYDSTLNSWRVSRIMFGQVISEYVLLLNGVLHFQISDGTGKEMIVTFDARLETFGHFEFPSSHNMGINFILLNFNGNLAYMNSYFKMEANYYDDLWVMTEYGVEQSWTKKTLGPFDFSGYCMKNGFGTPLAFWKNKNEQDELLILARKYTLSFNLDTMERTDLNLSLVAHGNSIIIPYNVETLLSLK
ncbi:F-box/kelch-repeat protein At3g06240-like [Impatiens glandulifera]|uniref:F-box/kelch-repeat protein At3g06240-like n=1 Tax=Impatiens glandulifera TaxID=253017 RepID=UPI001FB0CA19|nr:F-box/kelch-repeat protein At3g06240-like [Impatiens glandulifera]